MPRSKAELLGLGDKVSQVHPEKGRDIAHIYTDYSRWRNASDIYEVQYRMPYEPYYVASKRLPRYDASFVGYGNDKTEQCLELFVAKVKFKVLPEAFVFHVTHPPGNWMLQDKIWTSRSEITLLRFMNDIQRHYGFEMMEEEFEVIAGAVGVDCNTACKRIHKSCRVDFAEKINNCVAMNISFPEECAGGCSSSFYGHDLPAYNEGTSLCLVNKDMYNYHTTCNSSHPRGRRLCPCGKPIPQWLTANFVVDVLAKEGNWSKVPTSLRGAYS